MKTFLPVISPTLCPWQTMRLSLEALDNKRLGKQRVESYQIWRTITGLNKTKSWRTSPAIHMWRGYPDALGVYIAINCAIWARRKSETTGEYFSNNLMNQHIETYKFGRNTDGQVVYEFEEEEQEEQKEGEVAVKQSHTTKTTITLPEEAAAAASSVIDASAASSAAVAAPALPASASTSAAAQQRPGKYVNGVRVPWWFHDPRIHESDAAILHKKDPTFYKHFKEYAKKYDEYVWPRDLVPVHPEQKEELDELQAIIDAEEAEKARKKEEKQAAKAKQREAKKEAKKRKREAGEEAEEDAVASDAEQPAAIDDEVMRDVPAAAEQPTPVKTRKPRKAASNATTPVRASQRRGSVESDVRSDGGAAATAPVGDSIETPQRRSEQVESTSPSGSARKRRKVSAPSAEDQREVKRALQL